MALLVALVGLIGVLGAAAMGAVTQLYLRKHLGTTNGQGSLSDMVGKALQWQGQHAAQDLRIARWMKVPEYLLDNREGLDEPR